MADSLNKYVRRIQRKLNINDLESGIVLAIYFPYYIILLFLPLWLWDNYYNQPRVWQEQILIVIGAIGTFSLLILLPPIVRKVITDSRSVDWLSRAFFSLIGALIYFGMQIITASDPLEDDVTFIPHWVGIVHYVVAALLIYYWFKNRRSFSRIELSVIPSDSGVLTVMYGARKIPTENDQQRFSRNGIPVRIATRDQLREYKTKSSSTVQIHPSGDVEGEYDCKIVADAQLGWQFDSWSVYDEEKGTLLSKSNTIDLWGHHRDLIIFAHYVEVKGEHS